MTDDSEEIFRRAAEHYPLKTDNPDFSAVLKKMEDTSNSSDDSPVSKKKNKRWLLLLLLLIPFAVIELKYAGISGLFGKSKQSQPVVSSKQSNGKSHENVSGINSQPANTGNTSTAVATNKTPSSPGNPNEANTGRDDQTVATLKNHKSINPESPANDITSSKKESAGTGVKDVAPHAVTRDVKQQATLSNGGTNGKDENIHNAHGKIAYSAKGKKKVTVKNAEATEDDAEKKSLPVKEPAMEKPAVNENDAISKKDVAVNDVTSNDVEIKKEELAEKKPVTEVAKTPIKDAATGKTPDKDEKKKKSKPKHFYAGIIGGPDLSTIKLQDVKKVGISFGFVAGYKINNRFNIETGLLMDKKFYSSDGQYFSTEKLQMPAYANIEYVSGDCKMLELPINVYYNFSRKPTSNWFVSTGISSYFMNKETYTFDVSRYGQTYPYTADYKTHDNQFAAVINFSAGYTHKLGKICDLRIEPYIKLPVAKVGTGDLPIQSVGLMIGLTRDLF